MSSHSGETTIVRLDADLVNLARAYLSKRAKEPDVIGTALQQRDFETIQRIGHNLHGSGQMFGFGELTRIGAELQRAVVARDGAGIMRLKHRMAEFVSRVKVESANIDDDAVTSESGTRDSSVTVRRNHVLLVDDDEMNRILIAHYLEKEGYTVAQAASGEEALAALEIRPLPALILLDVVMPGLSGLDVCRHIKASRSTGAIPVVLLTALEKNEDRFRGMEAGADDFVTKPVTRVDLLARVSTLLPRPKHTAR